jgi:hypothetical protein
MAIGRIPEPGTGIPESIIAAKGDILTGTANDTPAVLSVGTNGHTLVADSAEATGLKWQAPAGGSTFTGVSCYKSTAQTVSNTTWTAVTFDSENFDTNSFHSTATNTSRLTIPSGKGGYYSIHGNIGFAGNTTGVRVVLIKKNGTDLNYCSTAAAGVVNDVRLPFVYTANLAAGDYVEVFVYQTSGGNLGVQGTIEDTTFSTYLIGA